jgi:hypothetical protein
MLGKCIMEPVMKKDVAVLITRAHRLGTTGIDGYSRQETSFPQGEGKVRCWDRRTPLCNQWC